MLSEGHHLWRQAKAERAALLIDGASYFGALRQSLLAAKHSIVIIGWDIHSETRIVGESGEAYDGFPEQLGPFLQALLASRPSLHVYLLVWNGSLLYAGERQWFPAYSFGAGTHERLTFCFDDTLPFGSAQHQKIVVVDDCVAFSGGCDLTIRRWDRSDHPPSCDHRVDPSGVPYGPFHDIQMVVDGDAARALAELVRDRWAQARCAPLPPLTHNDGCWPETVIPDFEHVDIGIARTEPTCEGRDGASEVEASLLAMIDAAERTIYIENQFLSAEGIAERIAKRMRQRPALHVLLISPETHSSWIESRTMRNGRLAFMRTFAEHGVSDRVALMSPAVGDGPETASVMVHAKLTIVDDRYLRVGSANLNNRSLGADTECDLIVEGRSEAERTRIERLRNALLGHHCGVTADDVAQALRRRSILECARRLSRDGHRLVPVDDGIPDPEEIAGMVKPIADPARPLDFKPAASRAAPALAKLGALLMLIIALALVWRYTPLREFVNVETLLARLQMLQGYPLAPLIVVGLFVLGGFVLFPVTVLIAVTAAALGPILGVASAAAGALSSAAVVYGVGRLLGIEPLRTLLGERLTRFQNLVIGNGVISVAMLRMVPVAPFSLVNLAAGATGIRFRDFVIGTLIGLTPGLFAMSALGAQLAEILAHPSWQGVGIVLAVATVWIGFSFGAQMLVTWFSKRA